MSKLAGKIYLSNQNNGRTAEIHVYDVGSNLKVYNSDKYQIFGMALSNTTTAKRYLTVHFGKGWKETNIIYKK